MTYKSINLPINSWLQLKTNPVITIYSPTNGIVQGTESMTTAAGSMQKTVLPQRV
jgi:hypothetical protein